MKVSTDGLLLGSFAMPGDAKRILDIGTGSGLLTLMMAQKSPAAARIAAIDIDQPAVQQAKDNVADSPWPDKISVIHSPVEQFNAEPFDFIIANPPYFEPSVGPTEAYAKMSASRAVARTEQSLTIPDFFSQATRLASASSTLCCMYPAPRYKDVVNAAAQNGWVVQREMAVKHQATKAAYLILFEFIRVERQDVERGEIVIRDNNNQYTEQYKALCRAFYVDF